MGRIDWPPKPIPGTRAAIRDARSPKASFRRNAAIALGRAEGDDRQEAIEALRLLLDDPDREVRIEAAWSARWLEAPDLAPAILALLGSADPDQRAATLEFLSGCGTASDIPRIEGVLEGDGDPDVRRVALEALETLDPALGSRLAHRIMEKDDPHEIVVRTAIAILQDDASCIDSFASLLPDRRPGVSLEAAVALAYHGDHRAIPRLLEEALRSRDPDDRGLALESLCRVPDERVVRTARERASRLFGGREEKIAWTAILAGSGDSRALSRLRSWIEGRDSPRAASAMRVAGMCSISPLVSTIQAIARRGIDGDAEALEIEAVEALGLMRSEAAASALRDLLSIRDSEHVRAAIAEVARWT